MNCLFRTIASLKFLDDATALPSKFCLALHWNIEEQLKEIPHVDKLMEIKGIGLDIASFGL